jgi:ABC-type transport system involved in multi-copper enzyme maturation permease subunit
MASLKTLIVHELKQQLKSKFFQTVFIFAVIIIYASLLLSAMSPEQEVRVLINFGLSVIELFAVVAVVVGLSSAILKDMESKTIYLILSRPVKKWAYLTAKYISIVLSVCIMIFLMSAVLISVLLINKAGMGENIIAILLAMLLKISLTGAMAMMFSLISSSVLSSVIITGIFYTLGHFASEIKFISKNLAAPAAIISAPLRYIIPNMTLFNLKDTLNAENFVSAGSWITLAAYAAIYGIACILISVFIFEKKEF